MNNGNFSHEVLFPIDNSLTALLIPSCLRAFV